MGVSGSCEPNSKVCKFSFEEEQRETGHLFPSIFSNRPNDRGLLQARAYAWLVPTDIGRVPKEFCGGRNKLEGQRSPCIQCGLTESNLRLAKTPNHRCHRSSQLRYIVVVPAE